MNWSFDKFVCFNKRVEVDVARNASLSASGNPNQKIGALATELAQHIGAGDKKALLHLAWEVFQIYWTLFFVSILLNFAMKGAGKTRYNLHQRSYSLNKCCLTFTSAQLKFKQR